MLHAVARRAADASAEAASLPYLAPEVHSNNAYDGRADVFSVGVLLWEVLEGKRLSSDGEEAAGLRVRSGPLPAPSAPEKMPWAKALVPVVREGDRGGPRRSVGDCGRHGCGDPEGRGSEARGGFRVRRFREEQVRRPRQGTTSAMGGAVVPTPDAHDFAAARGRHAGSLVRLRRSPWVSSTHRSTGR